MLTVGHGTLSQDAFLELLQGAGVQHVVDVRRYPGSRRHPHVSRDRLRVWLERAGIGYTWEEDLGGRRSGAPDSPHLALRNASFRAYADHLGTEAFRAALERVVQLARRETTAVMCAESVWWRCHRRLLADAAQLRWREQVQHLMHDGRLQPHVLTEGVRVDHGELVYDVGVDRPLDLTPDERQP